MLVKHEEIRNLFYRIKMAKDIFIVLNNFIKKHDDCFFTVEKFEERKEMTKQYNNDFKNDKTLFLYQKVDCGKYNLLLEMDFSNEKPNGQFKQQLGIIFY